MTIEEIIIISVTPINIKMMDGCMDLLPTKAHDTDAAFDLKSRVDIIIPSGCIRLVTTGVFLGLPPGFEAQIRPRSGLALKHGITLTNSPGTIDSSYRGEVGVIVQNTGDRHFAIRRGDRIAQMVIQRLPDVELNVVANLDETTRGAGGFGSTGVS